MHHHSPQDRVEPAGEAFQCPSFRNALVATSEMQEVNEVRETGLFVSHEGGLKDVPGGVQTCTKEYIATISAMGFDVHILPITVDSRIMTRLMKHVVPSAYFRSVTRSDVEKIIRHALTISPHFIFLNQVNLAVLAPILKQKISPACKIVLLSHGLESTDMLHFGRLNGRLPLGGHLRPCPSGALGTALLRESALRPYVDVVCTLSEFDVVLERWVGAKIVDWLPRTVHAAPLAWDPRGDRLGFVGTLDHSPNLEGLVLALDKFQSTTVGPLRIRVVGGPARVGEWLAARYEIVDYLGPLGDDELKDEAQTWNAFLHPIFCLARGCSTKLATAIAWSIPIVTTPIGRRGYIWTDGDLIIADDPIEFVRRSLDLLHYDKAEFARSAVARVARTSPVVDEVAERMRRVLGL